MAAATLDAWAVLGLAPGATQIEVVRAWRAVAAQLHPTRPGGSREAWALAAAAYRELTAPVVAPAPAVTFDVPDVDDDEWIGVAHPRRQFPKLRGSVPAPAAAALVFPARSVAVVAAHAVGLTVWPAPAVVLAAVAAVCAAGLWWARGDMVRTVTVAAAVAAVVCAEFVPFVALPAAIMVPAVRAVRKEQR